MKFISCFSGSKIFSTFVGFLISKDPNDKREDALIRELTFFNDYIKENVSLFPVLLILHSSTLKVKKSCWTIVFFFQLGIILIFVKLDFYEIWSIRCIKIVKSWNRLLILRGFLLLLKGPFYKRERNFCCWYIPCTKTLPSWDCFGPL